MRGGPGLIPTYSLKACIPFCENENRTALLAAACVSIHAAASRSLFGFVFASPGPADGEGASGQQAGQQAHQGRADRDDRLAVVVVRAQEFHFAASINFRYAAAPFL